MRAIRQVIPVLLLLLAPLGAGAAEKGFSNEEATKIGEQLTKQLDIAPDKRLIIHDRLAKWMAENRNTKFGGVPITGVFAYRIGEGGLIVKVMDGKGLLRYAGQEQEHPLKLKSVSVGATVGGGADYGVGIVLGPDAPMSFGGQYKLTQVGATAGTAGTTDAELSKSGGADRVVLLGTGNGFSASATGGELRIIVGK
jgi:hypothetical protein